MSVPSALPYPSVLPGYSYGEDRCQTGCFDNRVSKGLEFYLLVSGGVSMLPSEVIKLIGNAGDITIMEVEKGAIKRYVDAIGDFNPIYWDDEYAENSRYRSIVAPYGFFGWPTRWSELGPTHSRLREELVTAVTRAGYSRLLDGGIEYEFFSPARAGDVLAALPRITDIYERETKAGKLVFSVTETTYTNQNGSLIAKARQTLIHR
jgi:acyl dehydratase